MTYSDDTFNIDDIRRAHADGVRGHAAAHHRGWLLDEYDRLTKELGKARREQWNEHLRERDELDSLVDATDDL